MSPVRIDGLTPRLLQSSKSWWDSAFTQLLLDAIPFDTKQVVEIDCGLAAAGHTILGSRPDARYLGVDFNPERLSEAKSELEASRYGPRMELRLAAPTAVPAEDGSADVVLSVMSLQHIPNIPEVMAEALRLLRPKGRLVAVEPDNLGQRFYFDGVLEGINQAMHKLALRARVVKQPADIAVGPRLPELFRGASLHRIVLVAHLIHSSRLESALDFFERLHRVARTVALEAGLDEEEEGLKVCEAAVNRSLYAGAPRRLGHSSHTVPVFLCRGERT